MKNFWCLFFCFWPIAALVLCWIAPDMNWAFPGNRESATPLGVRIDDLFYMILVIVTIVFIATQIALGYALWTGSRTGKTKALFTHGSHNLEVIWTIVPSGILLFIALYQMDVWVQYRIKSHFPKEAQGPPIAEVTARQFEWRIRYAGLDEHGEPLTLQPTPQATDLYTVNDLHVPIYEAVKIQLRSADVQHSFFVPDLRVKQDAIPGQIIPIWFEVTRSGEFDLTCAELCGWGHYKMRGRVVVQTREEFHEYLKKLQQEQWYDGVDKQDDPSLAQNKLEVQQ